VTSIRFFLPTLNYEARSTTHQSDSDLILQTGKTSLKFIEPSLE
jgi:hypothetical protein